MLIVPAFGMPKQKDEGLKVTFNYTVHSRLPWAIGDLIETTQQEKGQHQKPPTAL